jgi:hypothetical protein
MKVFSKIAYKFNFCILQCPHMLVKIEQIPVTCSYNFIFKLKFNPLSCITPYFIIFLKIILKI